MKTRIVTCLSIFSFSIVGICQSNSSQLTNLDKALKTLQASIQFQTLIAPPISPLPLSNEPIPTDVKEIFDQIQRSVFGTNTLLTLRACENCQAVAEASSMSVNIEPKFLKTLTSKIGVSSTNIIAFVIAHEISHFTYEYMTLAAPNKLSPNGNIPLLTKSFIDFVDLNKFATLSAEEQRAEMLKYFSKGGKAHSEVDLLALLTLKKMNVHAAPDAISYLKAEILARTPEELSQTDFEVRLKVVTEAFKRGEL